MQIINRFKDKIIYESNNQWFICKQYTILKFAENWWLVINSMLRSRWITNELQFSDNKKFELKRVNEI